MRRLRADALTKEIQVQRWRLPTHREGGGAGVGDTRDSEGVGGILSSGGAPEEVEQSAPMTESLKDRGWKVSPCATQSIYRLCKSNHEHPRITAVE